MTLKEHVYAIQNIISRGHISDDKDFSNAFIAHLLKVNRALLIQRKLDKDKEIDPTNKKVICMPLVEASFADCLGCNIPKLNCLFLKGIDNLPKAISYMGCSYTVRTIDGQILPKLTVTNSKYNKYSRSNSSEYGWFILENKPYVIWPQTKERLQLELVLIEFIPEDPEELINFSVCNENEITSTCVQTSNTDFAIDSELINPLYKLTLEMLNISYSLPEDDLNNSVSADLQKSQE